MPGATMSAVRLPSEGDSLRVERVQHASEHGEYTWLLLKQTSVSVISNAVLIEWFWVPIAVSAGPFGWFAELEGWSVSMNLDEMILDEMSLDVDLGPADEPN